jgi:hypothetical protein
MERKMTTLNGLPAHILLVHIVVVLVPLSALLLVLVAVWPWARHRLNMLTAVLALVTLISVPLTTNAGEWLERRVDDTPLLRTHTELGDSMLPWAVGLFAVAAAVAARQFVAERRSRAALAGELGTADEPSTAQRSVPGGVAVTAVLAILAVVVGVGAVVQVYEIGESGARAAWTGHFSQQAHPKPGGPPREDH